MNGRYLVCTNNVLETRTCNEVHKPPAHGRNKLKLKAVPNPSLPPELEANTLSLLQVDGARPAAPRPAGRGITLGRHNCIIMAPQLHAILRPLIEMRLGGHRAAHPLLLSHRPELLERPGALNRRLVDPRARKYFVLAFLRREVALGRPRLVGCQVGVGFDDVVLDQGVACPAVDGEIPRTGGIVRTGVFDGS